MESNSAIAPSKAESALSSSPAVPRLSASIRIFFNDSIVAMSVCEVGQADLSSYNAQCDESEIKKRNTQSYHYRTFLIKALIVMSVASRYFGAF